MQDLHTGILIINQTAFVKDFIEEEKMRDCNSVNILIITGNFIDMHKADDYEEVDLKVYQQIIGKLMYLLYGIRLDIAFVVGQLSRQNEYPQLGHF